MGIVNVTPDSFSDGGQYSSKEQAIAHGLRLVAEGADMLDIGGESTRPGAKHVCVQEELDRVIPVIAALTQQTTVPISVDTSKPDVMREAVAHGAGMINDVRALQCPNALSTAVTLKVPVVLMHMQGTPQSMQVSPSYDDVLQEVRAFLMERILAAQYAGLARSRIVIDPGFGFGKTTANNLSLLANLKQLTTLGAPVLVGLSRKRCLGELTGQAQPQDRVGASVAAHLLAISHGASIVRVHDVAATKQAWQIWWAAQQAHIRTGDAVIPIPPEPGHA